jgi:succinoglycan biosynthesis protein ExoA
VEINSSNINSPSRVSIVVPCRNERNHIGSFLDTVLMLDFDGLEREILIADGDSDDGTKEIIEEYNSRFPEIRLISNPERIVSTGLNAAIRESTGELVIRMDVHTQYAPDYIKESVRVSRETGADNVGGPWVARGKGYIGRAIAAAFQSPFGAGPGGSHDPNLEGEVDTVYLGCWRRETFVRAGFFDEELVRNQDDEWNLRLRRMGGVIWQSPKILSWYHPRESLKGLFRQYLQYGYWKVRVNQKHRIPASWRHVVPGAFVLANLVLPLAGTMLWAFGNRSLSAACMIMWIAQMLLYSLISCVATTSAAKRCGWDLMLVLPIVFGIYHVSYGLGFLLGTLNVFRGSRKPNRAPVWLTRISR